MTISQQRPHVNDDGNRDRDIDDERWRHHLPEGWHQLFDELLAELGALNGELEISQAKEKFGKLRLYLERYPDGANSRIDAARRKSRQTCQECGAPGVLRKSESELLATVCDIHGEQMQPVARARIVASFRGTPDGFVASAIRDE